MNTELAFEVILDESKTAGMWISRCPRLGLFTQGKSEEHALQAIVEVIAFELLQQTKGESLDGASQIRVPLSLIERAANRLAIKTVEHHPLAVRPC